MSITLQHIQIDKKSIWTGIILGVVSGLMSFTFLAFLNFMLGNILSGNYKEISSVYTIAFSLVIILFIWSRRALSFKIIGLSQKLFWQLRLDVLSTILKSDYAQLNLKKDQIHSALVHDVGTLTQASLSIIEFFTSSVVIITCFAYMSYLSVPLFLATLLTSVLGVLIYQFGVKKSNHKFIASRDLEDGFMKNFNAIIDGFKEIHMNSKKGEAILKQNIHPISKEAYQNNSQAFIGFLNNQITGQVLFYSLIASILLFFSVTLEIDAKTTVNFLFILLYLLSSIETIMVLLPALIRAKISLNKLSDLKSELEQGGTEVKAPVKTISKEQFLEIKMKEVEFEYASNTPKRESFKIGPINMSIHSGDVIFIYGGNGSGKTTFILSLLGILQVDQGRIEYNNKILVKESYQDYKSLFSVVFNDFYLFDKFYGNFDFNRQKAEKYLKLFEIEEKVKITKEGFSNIDLSTGQKKRLALIAALLEEKPILVLDEWAADQDPYFRKKFYQEIIPVLKTEGLTIVAITHDDMYYNCSDKLLKMEYGKLIDESNFVDNNKVVFEYEH